MLVASIKQGRTHGIGHDEVKATCVGPAAVVDRILSSLPLMQRRVQHLQEELPTHFVWERGDGSDADVEQQDARGDRNTLRRWRCKSDVNGLKGAVIEDGVESMRRG
jgi:hypothetical protein